MGATVKIMLSIISDIKFPALVLPLMVNELVGLLQLEKLTVFPVELPPQGVEELLSVKALLPLPSVGVKVRLLIVSEISLVCMLVKLTGLEKDRVIKLAPVE